MEPTVDEVEGLTRAIHWRATNQIVRVQPDASVPRQYQRVVRTLQDKSGRSAEVEVRVLADPRANDVLWQIREGELIQSADRGRYMHEPAPGAPDRELFILSNIPTDIVPDRLTTWKELMEIRIKLVFARLGVVPMSGDALYAADPELFRQPQDCQPARARFQERDRAAFNYTFLPKGSEK